jgi:ABC-type phosphate/phosphonate transport system substrate-binding protein
MNRFRSSLSLFLLGAFVALGAEPTNDVFRIGVTYATFGNINRNDASAALKAYGAAVVRDRKLTVTVQVEAIENTTELMKKLEQNYVHAVSLTIEELQLMGIYPDFVYTTAKEGRCGEQYIILARRDSGLDDIGALRGRRLVRHVSTLTIPALPWMETKLGDQGLGRAKEFFSEMVELDNPSKTVLRVFFRQSDACLVTTNAYALACELNPQLASQLKVLSCSPLLIATVLYFKADYTPPYLCDLEAAIAELHKSTVGQQVLTIYQASRMDKQPSSCLETTLRMYEDYARLTSQTNTPVPAQGISAVKIQK